MTRTDAIESGTAGITLDPVLMRKLADEISAPPLPDPVAEYGPRIDRAPGLTRDAILQVSEQAAGDVELAADALMQMAIERVAEAKETARTIRELGAKHAATVERAANFFREAAVMFKAQRDRATAFRAEAA